MTKFEIGKRYTMRSICDSNCVWGYEVVARTNCSTSTGNRTEFCLQDIIEICQYNGVGFETNKNTLILKLRHPELQIEIQATITERENKMYITWVYRPYAQYNYITPILYMNEVCTEEHLITVLDMEQLKHMFDFDNL